MRSWRVRMRLGVRREHRSGLVVAFPVDDGADRRVLRGAGAAGLGAGARVGSDRGAAVTDLLATDAQSVLQGAPRLAHPARVPDLRQQHPLGRNGATASKAARADGAV